MKILLLSIAILLTSCTTQRITCWDMNGVITYMGEFDQENKYLYTVNMGDSVRDFYFKGQCLMDELTRTQYLHIFLPIVVDSAV